MKPLRFTKNHDDFIHAYVDVAGCDMVAGDLGFSKDAIEARVKKLKANGAWEQISRRKHAEMGYRLKMGQRIDAELRKLWENTKPEDWSY